MDTSDLTLPGLSRRTFLAGAAGAALLAACGDDAESSSSAEGDDGAELSPNLLALFAPEGVLVSGSEQRTVFSIDDGTGVPLPELPAEQTFSLRYNGEEVESITATAQSEGIPTPYYPVLFTPPEPGGYDITTTFEGTELTPRGFIVSDPSEVSIPGPGDAMIPVDTP
ncbi:MAG: hypothetical protein AAGK32_09260, partial [Actinomycetota bacterium]